MKQFQKAKQYIGSSKKIISQKVFKDSKSNTPSSTDWESYLKNIGSSNEYLKTIHNQLQKIKQPISDQINNTFKDSELKSKLSKLITDADKTIKTEKQEINNKKPDENSSSQKKKENYFFSDDAWIKFRDEKLSKPTEQMLNNIYNFKLFNQKPEDFSKKVKDSMGDINSTLNSIKDTSADYAKKAQNQIFESLNVSKLVVGAATNRFQHYGKVAARKGFILACILVFFYALGSSIPHAISHYHIHKKHSPHENQIEKKELGLGHTSLQEKNIGKPTI